MENENRLSNAAMPFLLLVQSTPIVCNVVGPHEWREMLEPGGGGVPGVL
jgi:hypothetical protein